MKTYITTIIIGLVVLSMISCSNDDDNTTTSEANVLVVYIVGNSSTATIQDSVISGIDVQWGTETFCYAEGGCSTTNDVSFATAFGIDSRLDITSSDDSRVATGVSIPNLQVNNGSGYIEVVSANVTTVDGFEEFEELETLFTSPVLSAGDTYSLEYGETQ